MTKEILIVDDEPKIRGRIKRVLHNQGYSLREADSVRKAIELLDQHPEIQLILLDLKFKDDPTQDGKVILEHIKNKGRYPDQGVIVLSEHEELLRSDKAWEYRILAYMPKGKESYDESLIYEVRLAFANLENASLATKLEKHFGIQKEIASNPKLEEILNLICQNSLAAVGGYTCHVRLLDLKNGDFVLTASAGPFENMRDVLRGRTTSNDVFSGRVATTGIAETIGDLQSNSEFLEMRKKIIQTGNVSPELLEYLHSVRSAYIIPISTGIFENKVDAVLNVSSTKDHFFSEDRCQVVNEFATQAEIAITKAWLNIRKKEAHEDYSRSNELLIDIVEQLRRENDIDKIYAIVVSGISRIVHAEMISIFRYNQSRDQLENVYEYRGNARDESVTENYKPGVSLTGTVFKEGTSIRMPSKEYPGKPTDHPKYDDTQVNLGLIPSHVVEHYLGVPIKFGASTIGVIRAVNKKSGYYEAYLKGETSVNCLLERGFSADCQIVLESIASHLAVAIANSDLVTKLNWKISQLETLTQVATEDDIDKLLSMIVSKSAEVMRAEICMLFWKDEKQNRLILRQCQGMPMIDGAFYNVGNGKTGTVAKTGEPVLEERADPNHPGKYSEKLRPYLTPDEAGQRRIRSFMAVPIVTFERGISDDRVSSTQELTKGIYNTSVENDSDGKASNLPVAQSREAGRRIIGVLKVYNKKGDDPHFDRDDLNIFMTFANQIGVAYALAERNTALSHFVRGVCHEIRNKAGMIPPNVTMIREDLAGAQNMIGLEPILQKLDLVEKAALQSLEFARDLLGFSASHLQVREDLNINDLIREAVGQFLTGNKSIKNTDRIDIVQRPSPVALICSVYRTPFIHIIQNIVINAFEAMEEFATGTLTITTGADESGTMAYVTLADTGKGISKEDIPLVFDATFFKRQGGNGLGLWLVKNYLARMDGVISVSSEPMQGAAFTIKLPRVDFKSKPCYVLVVEDDPVPRATIENILKPINCTCVAAQSGSEALAYIEQTVFDVIILDIGLPDMTGFEVLAKARKTKPDLPPVILITGFPPPDDDRVKQSGAFKFLLKDPLPVGELREAVIAATTSQF